MPDIQTPSATMPHQQLFLSVVFTAISDAILDAKLRGNGADDIVHWANSRDGKIVLRCAGIEPGQRCVEGLETFVRRRIRTSAAFTKVQSGMGLV
ncbi:DUF6280 family protein [uncultured Sulfitobacter sp.]|uniref:DUF6280 family protein n=1 Tax=uncultured Sulfitobacter sp. TaxID=191468 RepID=UPI00260934B2|nr:DUF6280 family protein [uncultured Sulfitobacter sp.]